MTILGANLSAAASESFGQADYDVSDDDDAESIVRSKHESVPRRTLFAILVAKMVVLPVIGLVSVWLMKVTLWRDSTSGT